MKFKVVVKNVLVITMLGTLLGSNNMLFASNINSDSIVDISNYYEYPLTHEDSEWFELSVEERVEACRIPQKILNIKYYV